jgi:uncharacterized membrane protein YcaP (DUF421 family)
MLEAITEGVSNLMGLSLEAHDLHWYHMTARASVAYVLVLALVRLGHKRFLGKGSAFDVILGILLGSVASRAITGNAPFFPTMAACAVLVVLHAIIARLSFRSRWFSLVIEGSPKTLIRDGTLDKEAMRATDLSEDDLLEALRTQGKKDPTEIQLAQLERSGKVSAVAKTPEAKILDVAVEAGVQTIRIRVH